MHKRWGWMLTLLKGKRFKVKLLYFKEGGAISKQRHKNRKETWLFIFGKGKMLVNKKTHLAKKGEQFCIPRNAWHKYTAKTASLVLEIQTGYCSERDIERV